MDIINAVSDRLLELCKERNITVNRLANLSAVLDLLSSFLTLYNISLIHLLSIVFPKLTTARKPEQVMPIVAQ